MYVEERVTCYVDTPPTDPHSIIDPILDWLGKIPEAIKRCVSQRRSGATTYDLHDRLGTASRQTNSSTATTATRTYDAFGLLVASTGTPQGPFGFVGDEGYQEDGDSGLKLLGHRYYDPSTGRFLTRDTTQDGRNWYAYCEGNPTRRIDLR